MMVAITNNDHPSKIMDDEVVRFNKLSKILSFSSLAPLTPINSSCSLLTITCALASLEGNLG